MNVIEAFDKVFAGFFSDPNQSERLQELATFSLGWSAALAEENAERAAAIARIAELEARMKTPDVLDAITYFEHWEPIYGDPRGDKLEAVKQATEDARQYFGFSQVKP